MIPETISAPVQRVPPGSEQVIVIEHLRKSFGGNAVLADFNLSLNKGENVAVLGKSGCGKSVLIKCIIGLLEPDGGEITVLGNKVSELNKAALDRLRAKIGFLFQSNALYDSMTVRENLEFPLRRSWMDVDQRQMDAMVLEALESVGLEYTVDMMPEALSGGMRKRIALARTLIMKPEIILYDEPTTGLDPITGKEISELIVDIGKKYDTSCLIISHDLKCIRLTSDRIVILMEGRAYAEGTFGALSHSRDEHIKQFFE